MLDFLTDFFILFIGCCQCNLSVELNLFNINFHDENERGENSDTFLIDLLVRYLGQQILQSLIIPFFFFCVVDCQQRNFLLFLFIFKLSHVTQCFDGILDFRTKDTSESRYGEEFLVLVNLLLSHISWNVFESVKISTT